MAISSKQLRILYAAQDSILETIEILKDDYTTTLLSAKDQLFNDYLIEQLSKLSRDISTFKECDEPR